MTRGKIAPELLQKIKDTVNIIEVIGEHVVLRKSGSNYSGLCPFHSERTPSFSVSENKQLYHCYGCKRGGDLVSFVMEMQGVSFPEAVEELAERGRIPLPKNWGASSQGEKEDQHQKERREKQALAFKLNRFAAAFFHQGLRNSPSAKEYLRARGVGEELVELFYLGSSTDSWDGLSNHLIQKKAPVDLAVELGLIRPSVKSVRPSGSPGYFDLFRNRVLFPILNLRGKVAGFGGRTLDDQTPKYLNSSDSLIFQKSKLAFGLYQAQKYIREQDEIILVEGYFDVLVMWAAGFRNVVATCGTSLTLDHLSLFKRLANRVTVLFDGDSAGLSATERAMEMGLEQGHVLYGARMPEGLDPDELILDPSLGKIRPEGKEKMAALLAGAEPLLDTRIEEEIRIALLGPEQRTQAIKRMGGWLARFKDPVGREVRAQLIQKRLNVSKDLIQTAMGKVSGSPNAGIISKSSVNPPRPSVGSKLNRKEVKMGQLDRILISGIVYGGEFPQLFAEAKRSLPPRMTLGDLFEYSAARDFMASLLNQPDRLEQLKVAPESFMDGNIDPQVRSLITEVLVSEVRPVSTDDFQGALSKSLAKKWARFSQHIKTAIADAELKKDAGLQAELMKEYLDVQRKMKEFSSFYDEE
jgi:DNA primase